MILDGTGATYTHVGGSPQRGRSRPDQPFSAIDTCAWCYVRLVLRALLPLPAAARVPALDHQVVGRGTDVREDHLADVHPEVPRALERVLARRVDLDEPAGELGVAGPGRRIGRRLEGRAVQGDARVAADVEQLQRAAHHPQGDLAVLELQLGGADPRRP